jgi:hypothetical protein
MGAEPQECTVSTPVSLIQPKTDPSRWTLAYGQRHQLMRIKDFPPGINPPKKVRIYFRRDHYVLQWWDPRARANLSYRVEGDLVAAISQARVFEERLQTLRSSGQPRQKALGHRDLVARYMADLVRRADAGEIDSATVRRYEGALRHYLSFCEQASVAKAFPSAATVNRDFRLSLAAFLAERRVSGNGRGETRSRPMRGQAFVVDTVRGLYEWALDPERGGLLPEGFHSPFRRLHLSRTVLKGDPLAEPDITLAMALDLVGACDAYQLGLFAPMLLFGLRAAEPCFLFAEYLRDGWLQVPCNADLNVKTKGKRGKRFPLLEDLQPLWDLSFSGAKQGLLYVRRAVADGKEKPPLLGASLADLITEFRHRCTQSQDSSAAGRLRLRDRVLRDAGGLTYDRIEGEFLLLARRLQWPASATVKDLRHLFATTMNNASMPEGFRRYLMGQAPGRAAIVAYTHLSDLKRHYTAAVQKEWAPLRAALRNRVVALTR